MEFEHQIDLKDMDLMVDGSSIFHAFPDEYHYFEVTAFDYLPGLFFPDAIDQKRAKRLCEHARIIYFAVKMHIVSMKYDYEDNHSLEMAILTGDLLSGRFAKRLIREDEFQMLHKWLTYLLSFFEELTSMAQRNVEIGERHRFHLYELANRLLKFAQEEPESFGPVETELGAHLDAFVEGFLKGNWEALRKAMKNKEVALKAVERLEEDDRKNRPRCLNSSSVALQTIRTG